MNAWDWSPYLQGGGTRPDAITGLQPQFVGGLQNMFANAPDEIRQNLWINSAYRSPDRQAELYREAVAKYGSEQAARKWVAPPGRSQHNHGHAADLKFGNDAAREWVHQNAAQYGLAFPMSHEPWHVELAGARGGQPPAAPQSSPNQGGSPALQPTMSTMGQPAEPQTFGSTLRAGAQSGALFDGLANMFNGWRMNPDPNIARMTAARSDSRQTKEQQNKTAAWLRANGMGQYADAVEAGSMSAVQAVQIAREAQMAAQQAPMEAERLRQLQLGNQLTEAQLAALQNPSQAEALRLRQLELENQLAEAKLREAQSPPPDQKRLDDLRQEYLGLPGTKNMAAGATSVAGIFEAGRSETPAGDIALTYQFMKLLDPGSTVMQGEMATLENAPNVPARIRQAFNSVQEGKLLPPEMRLDMLAQAEKIYTSREQSDAQTRQFYQGQIGAAGGQADALPDFRWQGTALAPRTAGRPGQRGNGAGVTIGPAGAQPVTPDELSNVLRALTPQQQEKLMSFPTPDAKAAYLQSLGLLP